MCRKKFLVQTEDTESTIYELTEKGIDLIKFVESHLGKSVKNIRIEPMPLKAEVEEQTVESWIEEYINVFPKGKHNGRYLRTDDCLDRMKWFVSANKYSKDIILAATKAYIKDESEKPDDYKYTHNASYFILKGRLKSERTSTLATWCRIVTDGEILDNEYVERDVV